VAVTAGADEWIYPAREVARLRDNDRGQQQKLQQDKQLLHTFRRLSRKDRKTQRVRRKKHPRHPRKSSAEEIAATDEHG
jgi:hypothetical protein